MAGTTMLIVFSGLPGNGKTTLARALPAIHVIADSVNPLPVESCLTRLLALLNAVPR